MATNAWNFGFNFSAVNGVTPVTSSISQSLQQVQQNASATSQSVANGFFQMQMAQQAFDESSKALGGMKAMKKDFQDYQMAISEVSTLWKESTVDMSQYENMVEGLSKKFGAMPVDTTKALYTAVSSGFTEVATAGPILETSMKLAIGGVTDVQSAMDGLTTSMHAWQLPATESSNVADAMFVAMRAGKTTIGEISREMGQSAALANTLGVNYSDLLAAMSALTLGGKTTGEAMNGLKGIMADIIRQDPGSQKAIKEWNKQKPNQQIDFSIKKFKAVGLQTFLNDIKKATGGDEQILTKLFGRVEALTAVMSLSGPQGEKYNEFLGQMKVRAGDTDVAVKKMMETSAFGSKRYEASFQVMKIKMGQALDPVLSVLRKVKWALVDMFTAIAINAPWLVQFAGALVMIVAVLGMIVAKMALFAALKAPIIAAFKAIALAITTAFAPVAVGLLPITAIILGLIALGYVLYKAYTDNWAGFGDGIKAALNWCYALYDSLLQLWQTGEIVGDSMDAIGDSPSLMYMVQTITYLAFLLKNLWQGMKAGFKSVGDILAPLKGSFDGIAETVGYLKTVWKDAFGAMESDASGAESAMARWRMVGWWIGYYIGAALRLIVGALGLILSTGAFVVGVIVSLFGGLFKIIQGLLQIFTGNFSEGFNTILNAVKNIVSSIFYLFAGLFKAIVWALLGSFGVSRAEFEAFWSSMGAFFVWIWNGMVDFIRVILQGINDAFMWCVNGLVSLWNNFGQFFLWVGSGIVGAWDWVVGKIVAIWNWFGSVFGSIGQWIKKQWISIMDWFEKKLGWIIDAANKLFAIGKSLKDTFVDIGEGLGKGAAGLVNRITGNKGNSEADAVKIGTHRAANEAYVPSSQDVLISSQTARPSITGMPPAVNVTLPPPVFNGQVVLDGRQVGEFVQTQNTANKEEKMTSLIPVMAGR